MPEFGRLPPPLLRAWLAAARGAVQWHMETGDDALAVPDGYQLPPLGRIPPAPHPASPVETPTTSPAPVAGPVRLVPTGVVVALEAVVAPPSPFERDADPAPAPAAPLAELPPPAPIVRGMPPAAALDALRAELGDCERCPLSTGRRHLIFGDGAPSARVFFVTAPPHEAEDADGVVIARDAGTLFWRMVQAMGLGPDSVYVSNIVKCRVPDDRDPTADELAACISFLQAQIDLVDPEVIVALGTVAARTLLRTRVSIPHLRGRWHALRDRPVMVTFHPAFVAHHPKMKRPVWEDLKKVIRRLGLGPRRA